MANVTFHLKTERGAISSISLKEVYVRDGNVSAKEQTMQPTFARRGLILPLIFVCLSCAKQSPSDAGESSPSGGTPSEPIIVLNSSGGTSSTSASMTYAEDTVDGLSPIDNATVAELMNDPVAACSGWTEEPEPVGTVLEFIVDVSGSMLRTAAGTNGATKWAVTEQALKRALDSLGANLAVGMTFFPNMSLNASQTPRSSSACVDTKDDIPIAAFDSKQKQLIVSTLDSLQVSVNAATPTHDAYNVGLKNIRDSAEPGSRYIALITDGQPTQSLGCTGTGMTCTPEPTQPVVDSISAALANDQIKKFVVGSPGSERNDCTNADVRDWLSAAARAGGTETVGCSDTGPQYCHFDLSQASDFGQALAEALDSIIKSVVRCDYDVPLPPSGQTIDIDRVNLIYQAGNGDSSLILPSRSDSCQMGWHFTDATKTRLRICDETCKLVQSDAAASVTLMFGCTQEQVSVTIL